MTRPTDQILIKGVVLMDKRLLTSAILCFVFAAVMVALGCWLLREAAR